MNEIERRLADLGERVRDETTGPLQPRRGALRRIRVRRGLVSGAAALSVVAVVAGGIGLAGLPGGDGDDRRPPPAATPSPEDPPPERTRCGIAFAPTYLPAGIDPEPQPGSGGFDDVAAAERAGIVGHFRGPRGTYIDVMDTAPPAAPSDTTRIRVLGAPARLGTIHEGFSVELRAGRCDYSLAAYGVTRSELRRFATGLTRVAPGAGRPRTVVWPEDTLADVQEACAAAGRRERTAPAVVWDFVTEVLGWSSPLIDPPGKRSDAWTVEPLGGDTYGGDVEAGVRVWTTEVVPGCFSVTGASRLPDRRPTGLGVSVRGRIVEIGFDALGAESASIEVGYGSSVGRRASVRWEEGAPFVRIPLRFDPDSTGSLLILLEDEDGDVFTAIATSLPEGDFSAC